MKKGKSEASWFILPPQSFNFSTILCNPAGLIFRIFPKQPTVFQVTLDEHSSPSRPQPQGSTSLHTVRASWYCCPPCPCPLQCLYSGYSLYAKAQLGCHISRKLSPAPLTEMIFHHLHCMLPYQFLGLLLWKRYIIQDSRNLQLR